MWQVKTQRGMALITAMLLLIVVTIMAISMFRSYGTQERIAGNTRDKQRALNAAISAQQAGEFWLTSNTIPVTGACSVGFVPSINGQVCNNPPLDFSVTPWNTGITYTQFTVAINNFKTAVIDTSGSNSGTADTGLTSASYYQAPTYYITDLGVNGSGIGPVGEVYQIDAIGYGGTANTVAVVESTFVIGSSSDTDYGHKK